MVATALGSSVAATTRRRERGILRAEAFIEQRASEAIGVQDICRAAEVSQRTLEYAFIERFGMTPQAFLKVHRLNMIHRQLRSAAPTTETITEIANRQGVWHMGQLASDYRTQFGQLPSTTLMKTYS